MPRHPDEDEHYRSYRDEPQHGLAQRYPEEDREDAEGCRDRREDRLCLSIPYLVGGRERDDVLRGHRDGVVVAEPEPVNVLYHPLGSLTIAREGPELEQRGVDAVPVLDQNPGHGFGIGGGERVKELLNQRRIEMQSRCRLLEQPIEFGVVPVTRLAVVCGPVEHEQRERSLHRAIRGPWPG